MHTQIIIMMMGMIYKAAHEHDASSSFVWADVSFSDVRVLDEAGFQFFE